MRDPYLIPRLSDPDIGLPDAGLFSVILRRGGFNQQLPRARIGFADRTSYGRASRPAEVRLYDTDILHGQRNGSSTH